jgi:hypothetical protein
MGDYTIKPNIALGLHLRNGQKLMSMEPIPLNYGRE